MITKKDIIPILDTDILNLIKTNPFLCPYDQIEGVNLVGYWKEGKSYIFRKIDFNIDFKPTKICYICITKKFLEILLKNGKERTMAKKVPAKKAVKKPKKAAAKKKKK